MTEEQKEKYANFLDKISEILGLNKPVDILRLCAVTDEYLRPIEKHIAELEAERLKWHDLRKDRQDLPTGKVNLDMYPDFMKSKVKPRIKVVAKICFKGYEKPTPWEDILYYEDGKWLELHHLQGKCIFFKEIPKCEYVLAWCEIPEYTEE